MSDVTKCELCNGTDFDEYTIVVRKSIIKPGSNNPRNRNFFDIEKTIKECLGCHNRYMVKLVEKNVFKSKTEKLKFDRRSLDIFKTE